MRLGSGGVKGKVDEQECWGEENLTQSAPRPGPRDARGGVKNGGGGVRREEKAGARECAAAKVLRNFDLSAGQAVVKAAASRRTPKQARGKKYF